MPTETSKERPIDWPTVLALALIAFWVLILATGLGTPAGRITNPDGVPIQGDYLGVYTAGTFALHGEPLAAYDWERHKAAQHALSNNPESTFFPWPYPPSFLLVAGALALLPYYFSMLTWGLTTFAAFAAAVAKITTSRRDMILMLATPAPWLNLYIGQNGALTATFVGFGLVLLPSRPILAGVFIGLLSIKPHLGLLIPFALLAGGYYLAFASAAATAAALALATTAVFGVAPWLAMPEQLGRVTEVVRTAQETEKLQSLFGMARCLSAPVDWALGMQAAFAVVLAGGVIWLWRRRDVTFDLKAAGLAAAMTLASPYQFVYDLVILTIAQAFLLRHMAATREASPNEARAMLIANLLVFLFAYWHIPLGVVGSAIVMGLILRRIANERRGAERTGKGCPSVALFSARA